MKPLEWMVRIQLPSKMQDRTLKHIYNANLA